MRGCINEAVERSIGRNRKGVEGESGLTSEDASNRDTKGKKKNKEKKVEISTNNFQRSRANPRAPNRTRFELSVSGSAGGN